MKKIIFSIFTIISLLFMCSFTTIPQEKYMIEVTTENETKVYYVNDINELELTNSIYKFKISEFKNNTYEAIFDIDLTKNLLDANNATHGKAFAWGYQVYFNHETMEEIRTYNDISAGISSIIGALSSALGPAGVAVGVIIGVLQLDWAIANKMDEGSGVTLSSVLYVTPVHWWNSGNCVRTGWF